MKATRNTPIFFKFIPSAFSLLFATFSYAEYVFTFEVTVNERYLANSWAEAYRADVGSQDFTYTTSVFTVNYKLLTEDLMPGSIFGADTMIARFPGLPNLENDLFDDLRNSVSLSLSQDLNPTVNSEMYVRERYSSQEPLPVNAWARAYADVYESQDIIISSDTSNENEHTFEYANWQSKTNILSQSLPEDFDHQLREDTTESLLAFIENYQLYGGLQFTFASTARYQRNLLTTYDPLSIDSRNQHSVLEFEQVGYVGTARLTNLTAVPIPSTAWLFLSAVIGLVLSDKKPKLKEGLNITRYLSRLQRPAWQRQE